LQRRRSPIRAAIMLLFGMGTRARIRMIMNLYDYQLLPIFKSLQFSVADGKPERR
jgi:hypothetical protein